MRVASGFVHQGQLDAEVLKAIRKLGKEVVRVKYNLDTDSTGDPSIFFRIVLTDAACREDRLMASADRVEKILSDKVRPRENWGLLPYFSYRSKSEQDKLSDPKWT